MDAARGSPEHPLAAEELRAKVRRERLEASTTRASSVPAERELRWVGWAAAGGRRTHPYPAAG